MTDWYDGECTCGKAFKIPMGGGMCYIQTVCGTCGDFRDIPRKYPDTPPELTEAQMAEYLAEGKREWEVYGRFPTDTVRLDSATEFGQRMAQACQEAAYRNALDEGDAISTFVEANPAGLVVLEIVDCQVKSGARR